MPKEMICAHGCGKPYTTTGTGRHAPRGHKECYDAKRRVVQHDLTDPAGGYAESVRGVRREHPRGWEPHVEENGNTATAISQPLDTASPDEEGLIRGWNLDPKQWRIVGHLNCRRWQASTPIVADGPCKCTPPEPKAHHEQRWLYYYKANLERTDPIRSAEFADLQEEIRTHVPIPFAPPMGDDALVIAIADTQMGKGDGDGAGGTVARFLAAIDKFEERIAWLRSAGRANGSLYILGMGDLIENCDGFYAQQAFRAELNRRDQVKVMRRLIVKAIERWSPLFERVVVPCVGGNHGENRKDGKSFTDFADNDDVAIFEQVQEILDANRAAYGHVSFVIPKNELSLALDMGG